MTSSDDLFFSLVNWTMAFLSMPDIRISNVVSFDSRKLEALSEVKRYHFSVSLLPIT